MASKNEADNKFYFDSIERKVEVNQWRKLINIIIAGVTLYLLLTYNLFDYTGNIIGVLLLLVWSLVMNYIVRKVFYLFMKRSS